MLWQVKLNVTLIFNFLEYILFVRLYWKDQSSQFLMKMLLRFSDSCHWDSAVIDFVLWACNRLIRRSRRPLGTLRNLRGTTTTEKCRIQRLSKTLKKWFEKSKRLFWKVCELMNGKISVYKSTVNDYPAYLQNAYVYLTIFPVLATK